MGRRAAQIGESMPVKEVCILAAIVAIIAIVAFIAGASYTTHVITDVVKDAISNAVSEDSGKAVLEFIKGVRG